MDDILKSTKMKKKICKENTNANDLNVSNTNIIKAKDPHILNINIIFDK